MITFYSPLTDNRVQILVGHLLQPPTREGGKKNILISGWRVSVGLVSGGQQIIFSRNVGNR